jgi:V/A-type H+-transporting ATPase subunit E
MELWLMPFDKITERILEDANNKAKEIRGDAKVNAEETLTKAEDEAEREKSKILGEAESKGLEENKRILALTRLEARNSVLAEKQRLVEAVFEEATKRLLSLPDDEYQKFIKNMLLKTAIKGSEEVIIDPADKNRIDSRFLAEVNQALRKAGKKGELRLADETRAIQGGFVLRSGGIEMNSSLEALVGSMKEAMSMEVLQTLLGDKA